MSSKYGSSTKSTTYCSAIPSSSESPAHPETAETAPPTTGEDAEANKGEALAAKLKSNRAVYIVGETAEKPKVVSDAIKVGIG